MARLSEIGGKTSPQESNGGGNMIFIRHGGTGLNGTAETDKIRGWKDIPLNDRGRQQAVELGKKYAGKIDYIATSDLSRAHDTAKEIAKTNKKSPVEITADLRPWDMGKFQGQHSSEVQGQLSHYVDNPEKPIPGGENFNSFKDRFLSKVQELKNDHPGENVALVAHYRNDRLLKAWDAKGNNDDYEIDKNVFLRKGPLEPGQGREMNYGK